MPFQKTHGMTDTAEYSVWESMHSRCSNPKVWCFHNYGGRGIKVCARWKRFENFFADMGIRPQGMTLERKDTNGNYSPDNCKWVPPAEQASNTRKNVRYEFGGKVLTQAQWSRHLGFPLSLIWQRLARGWSIEKTLSTPKRAMRSTKRVLA